MANFTLAGHGYECPSAVTGTTLTFVPNWVQAAGDILIVAIGFNDGTSTCTISDSVNGAYTQAIYTAQTTATLISQYVFYRSNIASAAASTNTITVTFSSSAVPFPDMMVSEFSSTLGTTWSVNQSAGLSANSSALDTSGAMPSTTIANALIYGAAYTTASGITAPGAGFTTIDITSPDGDIHEYQVVTSTGAYAATGVDSAPGQVIFQAVAFTASTTQVRTEPTASAGSRAVVTVVPIARSDPHAAAGSSAVLIVRRPARIFPTAAVSGSSAHVTVRAFVRPIPSAQSGSSAEAQKTINVPAASHSSASVTVRNPARPSPHGASASSASVNSREMARPSPAARSSSAAVAISANAPSTGVTFTPGSVYKNLSPTPIVMFGDIPGAMIDFSLVQGDRAEILQNAQMVLKTPLASVPLYRSFGVSQQWIGRPINQAQALICTDVLLRITYWEPRARCSSFNFSTNGTTDGSLGVQVSFEVDPNAPPASPLQTPLVLPVSKTVIDVSSGSGVVEIENVCA